ncbi:MAG TPA: EAL domain-containing protein [Phycisphaerae bacterium]|nr:EAL domain-containing protein [Phycisphaerae bacterium]
MTTQTNNENRRILIIDDSDAIHTDFRKTLKGSVELSSLAAADAALFGEPEPSDAGVSFEVDSAMQGQEGYELVKSARRTGHPYALAFVDMRMPPGWDGLETLEHLFKEDPEIQVVVCTAYSDYSWEEMTRRIGKNDRVLILKKPFDRIEVCQLATALTEKWQLKRQSQLKLEELEKMVHDRTRELKHLAMNDRLTGLPNRMQIQERLAAAIARAKGPNPVRSALMFLDFDRFKIVNDSLGHEIGDRLLVQIAERLKRVLAGCRINGHEAMAARLGGDEFVILLEKAGNDWEIKEFVERLLRTLAVPYVFKGHQVQSTASIGVTTTDFGYERPEEMLRDADSAMYSAKAAGKGRYVIFDKSMQEQAMSRLTLESDLHRAVERNDLRPVYQPIYSVQTGRIVGFESLVCWKHSTRGIVGPISLISLAEKTEFIVPLGFWVLREACRQISRWRKLGSVAKDISVSVNVSRRQLAEPCFVSNVRGILDEFQIPGSAINLEFTESMVMDNAEHTRAVLLQLRALGLGLHMDDFGTGYCTLKCLHALPLNCLKIDRSFISTMVGRRDYAAIINAIVHLAHSLKMQVVAEGVENQEQAAMILALDCDYAQGYPFASPLTPEDAERLLVAPEQPVLKSLIFPDE